MRLRKSILNVLSMGQVKAVWVHHGVLCVVVVGSELTGIDGSYCRITSDWGAFGFRRQVAARREVGVQWRRLVLGRRGVVRGQRVYRVGQGELDVVHSGGRRVVWCESELINVLIRWIPVVGDSWIRWCLCVQVSEWNWGSVLLVDRLGLPSWSVLVVWVLLHVNGA